MALNVHAIPGLSKAYYIPNFLSEEEEAYLIRKIVESPQQKWKKLPNRRLQIWGGELTAKNRLLPQPLPPYITDFPDVIGRIQGTGAFTDSPHGKPNHVILNEYLPGQGIMPHEDGPSYYPVVATLSLGSHALFHYYRYRDTDSEGAIGQEQTAPANGKGRIIDPLPVASVFLEPRSLIITTGDLYTGHLHGIDEIEEDVFPEPQDAAAGQQLRVPVSNAQLLSDNATRDIVMNGGTMRRDVRYSLTCRDIERVASAAGLAIGRR